MTQWYVKELSRVAGVSVRALHHYDSIGLLKPSIRKSNGYRVYSSGDLWKLQKIKALKDYGFSLKEMQALFEKKHTPQEMLILQKKLVSQKIAALEMMEICLEEILSKLSSQTPPSPLTLKMMEMYTVSDTLHRKEIQKILED